MAAVLAASVPAAAPAQDQSHDPLFDARDGAVAGAFVLGTGAALTVDRTLAEALQDPGVQQLPGLHPATWTLNHLAVPGALILGTGLYGVGMLGGHDATARIGLHMGAATVTATAVTYGVKVLVGRARPSLDSSDPFNVGLGRGVRGAEYRAFPSGHTAIAFAAAAAAAGGLDREWPGHDVLVGALTYGPAALVGLARMLDNRHWASDVIFGAAIGSFAGWKVVEYADRHPSNTLDDWFLGASVVPGHWTVRLMLVPAL